ncbi:hypothetical protein JIN77_07305 [Verrucomicrobiaceae bacterium R5-34]|nr:hypothetical protein [Verrucomicrobiaceae bacterium R5-34]
MKVLLLAREQSDLCPSNLYSKAEQFENNPIVNERIEFTSTSSEFIQIRYLSQEEQTKTIVSPFGEKREIQEFIDIDFSIFIRSQRVILVANPPRSSKKVFSVLDRLFPSEQITYHPLKLGNIYSLAKKSDAVRLTELKSNFRMVDGGIFKQEIIRKKEGGNSLSAHMTAAPEQLLSLKMELSLQHTEIYIIEFRSLGALTISPEPSPEIIFDVLSRFNSDSTEK